mmetsp:Transcript_95484/g.139439  ORF Transcript_95484/g.139439 Transcript_95484/m.139439 type:complete len:365 (+) Transcript_95484:1214-2308(+)
MRAPTVALAALKVAVGSGGAALSGLQLVGVHGKTHGTAGLPPIKTSLDENLVKTLTNRLLLDHPRAGHNHGVDVGVDLLALGNGSNSAQVLNTPVGARTNKDLFNLDLVKLLVGLETHVLERALHRRAPQRVLLFRRVRHEAGDRRNILRRRAPRHCRCNVRSLDNDFTVILGTSISAERPPVRHSLVPLGTLGGKGTVFEVIEGNVIRGDHASARASLDSHVTHRHASLHRQIRHGVAAEFNHAARATSRADHADNVKDHILRGNARAQLALHLDLHVLGLLRLQCLRSQHVLHLRSSDTKGKRAKGTVRSSVAVAAHYSGAREGEPLLRADDVNDTLPLVLHAKVGNTELLDIVLERYHLRL